jgi:hypothetical protein
MDATNIMRVFDVPPWVAGPYRKPRFARVRWMLRRWWKIKAEPTGPLPHGLFPAAHAEEKAFVENMLEPHMRSVEQRLQEDFETMRRQWEREPHGASGAGAQEHPEP